MEHNKKKHSQNPRMIDRHRTGLEKDHIAMENRIKHVKYWRKKTKIQTNYQIVCLVPTYKAYHD